MNIHLLQRLQLLLQLVKDDRLCVTARENLAAAKELVDTLFATGHLDMVESRAYRSMCTTVGIMISTAELARAASLPKTYKSFDDGIRASWVMV